MGLSILNAQWKSGLWIGKQANNWYFGNKEGLNFNTSPATPLNDGQIISNGTVGPNESSSGTGSISDSQGNLLFYTNGITVWNKNHTIMQNGQGLYGGSDGNVIQSGLIVPAPGHPNLYYIFSVDNPSQAGQHGLSYSEVDLSLDSGLGAVTSNKNIQLATSVASKVTATFHSDGNQVWVVAHVMDSNEFIAFLVSANGVFTTPVTSSTGETLLISLEDFSGQMKFSPNGKRIGFSNPIFNKKLQVFDFDATTGVISDPIVSMGSDNFSAGFIFGPWGFEFSPNSQLIYVTEGDNLFGFGSSKLHQLNLTAGDETAIIASDVVLKQYVTDDTGHLRTMCGLQLGPDGKIYQREFSQGIFANVINYPNNIGLAAGFDDIGIDTHAVTFFSDGYFPSFIQSYFASGILYDDVTATCAGTEVSFSLLRISDINSVNWNFGDPGSGASNLVSGITAGHVFTTPGAYTVTAEVTSNGAVQATTTQVIIRPGTGTPSDLRLAGCSPLNLNSIKPLFSEGTNVTFYVNNEDAENSHDPILDPESYPLQTETAVIYVRAETAEGCVTISPFSLKTGDCSFPQGISPGADGKNDTLDLTTLGAQYGISELEIFSRYGRKVYEESNYVNGWHGQDRNGGELPTSTYFYVVKLQNPHPLYGNIISKWIYLQRQE